LQVECENPRGCPRKAAMLLLTICPGEHIREMRLCAMHYPVYLPHRLDLFCTQCNEIMTGEYLSRRI
jgi:hypothetical protein